MFSTSEKLAKKTLKCLKNDNDYKYLNAVTLTQFVLDQDIGSWHFVFPRTTQVILAAEIQNRANSAPFPTCQVVVLSLISSYIISGNQPRWLMCW